MPILFYRRQKSRRKRSHVFPYLHSGPSFKIMKSVKGILILIQWHLLYTIYFYFYWENASTFTKKKKSQYIHSKGVRTKNVNECYPHQRYKSRTDKDGCGFHTNHVQAFYLIIIQLFTKHSAPSIQGTGLLKIYIINRNLK